MNKLNLKLKKLCTYYSNYRSQIYFYPEIENNKIIIYYDGDVSFRKRIIINGLDDISYKISKLWIKKNYHGLHIFDNSEIEKMKKTENELEKLKSIRDYTIEYS